MEYSTSSITLSVIGIHHLPKICRTNSCIEQKIGLVQWLVSAGLGPLILTENNIKSLHVISFFHFLSIFFIPVQENLLFVLVSQMFTVVFRLLSHCLTLWPHGLQHSLSFTISWSLLKLMSIESVRPSNHLIFCCPLFLLPSVFPITRVFSNDSVLRINWPEYWSFSISISPSNKYSGLISFRMDWLDLLAVQGTLKSLL